MLFDSVDGVCLKPDVIALTSVVSGLLVAVLTEGFGDPVAPLVPVDPPDEICADGEPLVGALLLLAAACRDR
ncbi:MAG: hypothetical protein EBT35_09660, partial [Alphaproteobacteria bacterium]|nr:hypothetical protein [Alphaproteobacteria bacterium]